MPTTQTQLFPPNIIVRGKFNQDALLQYIQSLQYHEPLRLVDTSGGNYAESAPAAGLNTTTGRSNQDQEISYVKTSADGNTFTLNGVQGGAIALTAQFSRCRIKSDGTNWWRVA